MRAGAPCQPPVETGEVDEHEGIRAMLLKDAIRQAEDTPEFRHIGENAEKTHKGHLAERVIQPAASRGHALTAKTVYFQTRLVLPQSVDEIRTVKVAAGFARADEQTHGEHPALENMRGRPSRPSNFAAGYQKIGKRDKTAYRVRHQSERQ
jgi:hypothetical protein